jgi:Domain of Unknown Function (DUF928)
VKSSIGKRLSLWGLGLLSYPVVLQMSLSAVMAAPIKLRLPPPPQRGIAGSRAAAASRTTCPIVAQPLTAIVPEYRSAQGNQVWGLTKMEHPTFWFYVPYAKPALVDISFTLQDESNPGEKKIVYQNSKISAASTPGMMRITLPKSSPALAANQPYRWFLELNMGCTSGQRPIFVEGWIQRTELDHTLSKQIDRATPTDKVSLYAENGLWHDALTTLANLRATKPQDPKLTQDWQNLLDAIGLKDLVDQSLSENRQFNSPKETLRKRFQQLKSAGF